MAHIRVLLVTNMWPYPADAGYGSFVAEQMESLRPLGVDYDVVFINGRESRWNYLKGMRWVWRKLQGGPYDLIHAHFGLSGWVARFQWKAPLVVTFHGDDALGRPDARGAITPVGRLFQASSYLLARCARATIVQSVQMKEKLGLDSARVIPCGIDLDLFHPIEQSEARRHLGLDLNKKYVIFPYNRDERRKRYDLIEESVARARKEIPELEILHVRRQPHAALPLYMNACDVFVLASTIEGSPMALKEAMAVNLPVIAVDVGDARERIEGTEGNYLVLRDAGAIARKLAKVCQEARRSRSRESLSDISMASVARRILEVYGLALR